MLIVSMQQVEFGYVDIPCIQDAQLDIQSGEFVAVIGPNGAAKSTLLKLMLGLIVPWKGRVFLSQTNSKGEKLQVGYVSQQIAGFNSGFPSNILEFVRSGRFSRIPLFSKLRKEDKDITETTLRQLGMWDMRKRRIGELSGGQKQRICIARALSQEPDLLVLDEPTTGMDYESRIGFYQLMHVQAKTLGRTVVMVTHNLEEVSPYINRVIALERKEEGGWKCCTTTSCNGHFVPVG
ncbi:metal ABC transporter ATP-binding protein [Paenibacillus qinlingensis]|uniref:metal ABC transporter ATP-binding protein n=1 Tax=Paenibacillus qinlingensis TaxID=1837343 RepID=UPI001563F277|nr:metal ABC transporter ATP-binding protein [Paenibacillus qinlingensis]NQX58226.1 metal ABC transporter ATP-binding protein [Paenibacillus qinlingensis]